VFKNHRIKISFNVKNIINLNPICNSCKEPANYIKLTPTTQKLFNLSFYTKNHHLLTSDHIIPKSVFKQNKYVGVNQPSNIQILCYPCNQQKSTSYNPSLITTNTSSFLKTFPHSKELESIIINENIDYTLLSQRIHIYFKSKEDYENFKSKINFSNNKFSYANNTTI
jgi:hypothetical protein